MSQSTSKHSPLQEDDFVYDPIHYLYLPLLEQKTGPCTRPLPCRAGTCPRSSPPRAAS